MLEWLFGVSNDDVVHASARGSTAFVMKALDRGNSPNVRCGHGHTPLGAAVSHGHFELARLLLQRGAMANFASISSHTLQPLGLTAEQIIRMAENEQSLQEVIATGLFTIQMPLHDAAATGNTAMVDLLLAAGADPNMPGSMFITPLIAAAGGGHLAIADRLIRHGARLDARLAVTGPPIEAFPGTLEGFTALAVAAHNVHPEMVRLLASWGADPNVRLALDSTPLHAASANGFTDLVRALLDAGADTEARLAVFDGATPLMFAATMGCAETVALLASRGASRVAVNDRGLTAAALAAGRGHHAIAAMLASGLA